MAIDGYAQVLNDGARVGAESALAAGHSVAAPEYRVQAREFSMHGLPGVLPQANHLQPSRAFVDFQNDVTTKDLALAMREGFESVEHIKRYTTTGMATDQGKTSNMNALAFVAGELGRTIPQGGTHDVPHALHAGHVRHLRGLRPWRPVRSGPHDADARLGGAAGRRVRGRRPVEAGAVFPASRRGHARGRRS